MRNYFSLFTVLSFAFLAAAACHKDPAAPGDDGDQTKPNPAVQTRTFSENGFTLTFENNDPYFDTTIRQKMVNTFFTIYPEESARFNPAAPKAVTFVMDTSYSGVAATYGTKVRFSAAYYHSHPNDIDVVTHESMHIVQGYPHYNPVWLVEGIADYARYTFGVNNIGAGWTLPDYAPSQSYTNSYRVTARFLVWLQVNVDESIADRLDSCLRKDTYTNDSWKTLTGSTVDELWADYGKSPGLDLHYK